MLHQVRPINKSFCLQMLCEENYSRVLRLLPKLQNTTACSFIQVQTLETGPFTKTILLQQANTDSNISQTRFKCRVYLDTKSVEVISIDDGTPTQAQTSRKPRDVMNNKWTQNYLLEKWLNYQLHSFRILHSNQQSISA